MPADHETDAQLDRRASVIRARMERLDALARKALRRRSTRSRIILGGSILAEIRDNPDDTAFRDRIVAILEERVYLARDRDDLRVILGLPLSDELSPASRDGVTVPDFENLSDLAARVSKSVADDDPDFADVRHLTDENAHPDQRP